MWLAYRLPRRLAYWAFIRVQTFNCQGNPAERAAPDSMDAWEFSPEHLREKGVI